VCDLTMGKRSSFKRKKAERESRVPRFPRRGLGPSSLLRAEQSRIWGSAAIQARAKEKSRYCVSCGTSPAPEMPCLPIVSCPIGPASWCSSSVASRR
jgi:hypothetical protein